MLGVALMVITERHWRAGHGSPPLRLRGDVLELPVNLFQTRSASIRLTELRRISVHASGSGSVFSRTQELVIETTEHRELYSFARIRGGESAARAFCAQVEAALAEIAPDQLARLRAHTAQIDALRARKPILTMAMLATIAVAFAVEWFLLRQADDDGTATLVALGANVPDRVRSGEVWRLVTANSLHTSYFHVFTNSMCMGILGAPLERVLGPGRTAVVLAAAALGGQALSSALSTAFGSVGASSMVYGALGAGLALHLRLRDALPIDLRLRPRVLAVCLTAEVIFNLPTAGRIDHYSHVGGFISGLIAGLLVARAPRLAGDSAATR